MTAYIVDGYTREDGYIAAAPAETSGERLWDELEFSYRPATRQEVIKHDAEVRIALRNENVDPMCAVRAERLSAEFVAKKIVSWNLKDPAGAAVAISTDSCMGLQVFLFQSLYGIIRGTRVSDPRPDVAAKPTDDEQVKN